MSAQQVIDKTRPMLEDILGLIGLHSAGHPLDLRALLDPFSQWVERQNVRDEDVAFLTGLIGAFISEYLIEHHSARRIIRDEHIYLQLPIQVEDGVWREFEPYKVACDLAQSRGSLEQFIHQLAY